MRVDIQTDRENAVMMKTIALLISALTLTLPAIADDPSNTKETNAIKNPNKAKGEAELNGLQFGVARSLNNPVGKGTSRESGQPSGIHITPPVRATVTPAVKAPTGTKQGPQESFSRTYAQESFAYKPQLNRGSGSLSGATSTLPNRNAPSVHQSAKGTGSTGSIPTTKMPAKYRAPPK
jgi:hypothetical protein